MAAVDDLLKCAVCLDWFRSPRRLPCHHVYCLQCIRDLVIHDTDYITCPECLSDHVMPNGGAEDFPTVPVQDGRLKQFIATQRRPDADWCKDCQQEPSVGECEHCQLLTCLQCQTKHRDLLLATLIQQWRQFHNEYFSDSQMVAREKLKNKLLRHKENIEAFKTSVNTEIDDLIKALEIRRLSLITRSEEKEHFIVDQLLMLEKAELISAQNPSYITRLEDTRSLTKGVVSMKEELVEQKHFMSSLQSSFIKKGMLCITFKEKQNLLDLIDNYGQVTVQTNDVDYRNDFTLIKTIDGSESGAVFNIPRGLAVCPSTDNVYVTDKSTIRVYDSDGVYIRHVVTDDEPRGVTIDSKRRVIVTSGKDKNVKIYSDELKLMKTFGSEGSQNGQFKAVYGVTCDQDDNIYVADFCNNHVQVFTYNGTFLSVIGCGILQYPMNIKVTQRQEVMVINFNNLHIFHTDGRCLRTIIGSGNTILKSPRAICLDATGRILVGDSRTKNIQVFTANGRHYCTIGEPAAAMMDTMELAVTASGVIFITDFDGNKLHMIAST